MDNNKTNITALIMTVIALSVGLVFAINYKQNANADQLSINEWQSWNNNNQHILAEPPEELPPSKEVVPEEPKTYQEALLISKKTGKQIFLFFHADWCHWCEKMERETLSKAEVKQALSNYIVYFVDTGKEPSVSRKYVTRGIPTYVITNHTERVLKRGSGYRSSKDFTTWLNGGQRPPQLPERPSPPPQSPG
jgi:thiol:disulfide interchange protein